MKKVFFLIFLVFAAAAVSAQEYPGFRTEGRFLYDHLGEKVVLVGVNKMIYWMDTDGLPSYPEIAKTGANCVRVQWLMDGTPEQLDKALYNCRANNMIPMIELHDATGEWGMLQELVDYWVRPDIVEIIQKHEQYLLVNIGNEVGQTVSASEYQSGYETAVTRMRLAGINTPLVIDGGDWGKDIDVMQATGPYLINIDPNHNLIFSVHMWWPYMWGYSEQTVIDEIAESVAMDLPLIVGEFGGMWEETATGQIPYHTIIDECTANEIGWLLWSWGPGNDPQEFLNMTDDSTFDTLHDWGLDAAVTYRNSIANTAVIPFSITSITPVPTPSPTPHPPNLISIGKSVTASSVEPDNGNDPEFAVDGNLDTRWASDYSDPGNITIDLGSTYDVYKVILHWETAFGSEYQLQTSGNGSTWIDLFHENNGDGGVDEIYISATARYVRMNGIRRDTEFGYSLWEFEVYGVAPGEPVPTPPGGYDGIKVRYKCAESSASASQIKPYMNIVNGSTASFPLTNLKARYYYSNDNGDEQEFHIDYAVIGSANIKGEFFDNYVEISFTQGAGSLSAGSETRELQVRLNHPDWAAYDQSNDYSFDGSVSDYTDWDRITLYYNGELIWGVPDGEDPVTTPTPTQPPAPTPTRGDEVAMGDANNDGTINIVDALMTAQYSVGLAPPGFYAEAADVNGDDSITIVDALMIAQYSVGLITEF